MDCTRTLTTFHLTWHLALTPCSFELAFDLWLMTFLSELDLCPVVIWPELDLWPVVIWPVVTYDRGAGQRWPGTFWPWPVFTWPLVGVQLGVKWTACHLTTVFLLLDTAPWAERTTGKWRTPGEQHGAWTVTSSWRAEAKPNQSRNNKLSTNGWKSWKKQ